MTDLQQLFSQDPLTYTKEGSEIAKIVAKFRESRGQFSLGAMKAGKTTPPKSATGKAAASLSGLSLNLQSLINPGEKK